jgi:hypothetical protein
MELFQGLHAEVGVLNWNVTTSHQEKSVLSPQHKLPIISSTSVS